MHRKYLALPMVIAWLLGITIVGNGFAVAEDLPPGHSKISGVVMEKAGALVVTTPGGATHQLNANMARRHGQQPFKAGDEVIAVLDENNYIVDMHLKGQEGKHQLVTGKLVHVGLTKNKIKLQTAEGEKIFPLTEQAQKTKNIPDGALVTVELNEAGAVIDLHRAETAGTGMLQGERRVKGTVVEIKAGQIQLKTGEVEPRFIPLKAAREKGFPEIKIGDVIELTLNDQNLLVDYHLLDASGQPLGYGKHRVVRGQIAQPLVIGHDRAVIRTQEGSELNFMIRTQARSKMASIPVGSDAVFMVDETNMIVDVDFASKEAAERAGQMPEQKSSLKGAQQRVAGIVVKPLEANRITIRTLDGQEQLFEVRPLMREKVASLPKGEAIILLIDGEDQVADVAVPPGQMRGQ